MIVASALVLVVYAVSVTSRCRYTHTHTRNGRPASKIWTREHDKPDKPLTIRKKQVSAADDRPRDAVLHAPVLYTDVDDQCDKLVTDDRHQFITLAVHLS